MMERDNLDEGREEVQKEELKWEDIKDKVGRQGRNDKKVRRGK